MMARIAVLAALVAAAAMPASASDSQLARKAGVEPGLYSSSQLIRLLALQQEGGSRVEIWQIRDNPLGGPLVARLSTRSPGTGR